ncbi:hypothetical protein A2121_01200 [Candidatus Nomurabacteria bacterium GWB1_40_6]|uniref:Uncharacterized protein n=1 Tax=Candidatus Nomurabacteria bacterium GWB1_40_6 TaxID=1801727 RepID=A0A1F6TLY0_9BACT|nr:MAG: hypothetical protein A2121_01200 [Candidatus Nomurabacteria bacterium GWB1_40_6]
MKIELSKLFKKEKKFKKKDFTFNAYFYWKLAIVSAFFLIVSSFFFGYYLFTKINKEPNLSATPGGGQVPTIDKSRIEETFRVFSEREKKSAEILNSPAPIVDPSL